MGSKDYLGPLMSQAVEAKNNGNLALYHDTMSQIKVIRDSKEQNGRAKVKTMTSKAKRR